VKATSTKLLAKAERALGAAQRLLDADPEFAISRAYYAMFYATTALLYERGLAFRKHAAVHAALAEHFTRAGGLDPKYHRWLLDASDARNSADYGVAVDFTPADAAAALDRAKEFVAAVRGAFSSTN
jgi:uncharacterized protein (UPF0332 family)